MYKTVKESECVGCAECIGCGRNRLQRVLYVKCDRCGTETYAYDEDYPSYKYKDKQYCEYCVTRAAMEDMSKEDLISLIETYAENSDILEHLLCTEFVEKIEDKRKE